MTDPIQPIAQHVAAEVIARSDEGKKAENYGVDLTDAPLTIPQVLQHAKEECLDLACYIERLIRDYAELERQRDELAELLTESLEMSGNWPAIAYSHDLCARIENALAAANAGDSRT